MAQLPLVSVCIPTFNRARMLKDSLHSACSQTYRNLEILVVDNCSDDSTEQETVAVANDDRRIRYVRHPRNIGMSNNFNSCLTLCSGELVLVLGADDYLETTCISSLVQALQMHPHAVLAACGRALVDENLHLIRNVRKVTHCVEIDSTRLLRECVAWGNKIGEPSAVLFRRASAIRGFNTAFNQFLDLEMWIYLLRFGSAVFVPEPLSRIRQHSMQMNKANLRSGGVIDEKKRLFDDTLPTFDTALRRLDKVLWDLRMAYSVARFMWVSGANHIVEVKQVFFHTPYQLMMLSMRTLLPTIRIVFFRSWHRQ